jgi:signal transduction histidine kinase
MIAAVRDVPSWMPRRDNAARYLAAVATTLLAFAGTDALRHFVPTPTFLFFIPAVVLSAWYGGLGPSLIATSLSLTLIEFMLPARSLRMTPGLHALDILAFLITGAAVALMMEALRRARRLAESHATELERVNAELQGLASRGTKLLEVITALSQARSVGEVADVVLGKGLALLEASRGILVYTDGAGASVLGVHGMGEAFASCVDDHGRDADLAVTEAIRTGKEIWIGSADEYRERYPWASNQLGPADDLRALCAIPLIHAGETIGGLAMGFAHPEAFGVADRAFTLLMGQATAAALHRAWSYDAERHMRRDAELLARAREEALAIVAHDLRNPLSLINATTQLLHDEVLPQARQKAMLEVAARAAKQMNRLIGDLLDTVRLQAGRLSLDVEILGVDEILHQTEETFQPIAREKRVRLDVIPPEGHQSVSADPLRVSQIVGNLVGNALKFTPANGQVTVGATARDGSIVFQVRDSGPGIPPDHLEHLFDKFWQARPTDHRGAGLGLAIARGLVEAHGGRMWVESTVGSGSTFTFSIPAATTCASQPAA